MKWSINEDGYVHVKVTKKNTKFFESDPCEECGCMDYKPSRKEVKHWIRTRFGYAVTLLRGKK